MALVPASFVVPDPPRTADLLLTPLGEEHNEADLAAWSSSTEHIRATPGFAGHGWPPDESYALEQNAGDLREHAVDFAARTGFTWTVLDPGSGDVIGCVYAYPPETKPGGATPGTDVWVRSWVRADLAHLDAPLFRLMSDWLQREWPWTSVDYAAQ